MEKYREFINERANIWTSWRRYFHHHPELIGNNTETTYFIKGILEEMGYTIKDKVKGFDVEILGEKKGPHLVFFAEMNAQRQVEKTKVPYRSKEYGLMHAVGNDVAMTILLGICDYFSDHPLPKGSVECIFKYDEMEKIEELLGEKKPEKIFRYDFQPLALPGDIQVIEEKRKEESPVLGSRENNKEFLGIKKAPKQSKDNHDYREIIFSLGSGFPNKNNPPLKDPYFNINEDCIPIGVHLGLSYILREER